jgi:hypothetical protein
VIDRRHASRYVLLTPRAADLVPLQDIVVERMCADRVVAICPALPRPSEPLTLRFAATSGALVNLDADVVTSEPVVRNGRFGFRVELRLRQEMPLAPVEGDPREALVRATAPAASLPAVLMRRHAVAIRDISSVGCLLDASAPFDRGTIALLETCIEDRRCTEATRITRVVPGGATHSAFLIGAEFLPLSPASATSLRAAIAALDARDGSRR